MSRHRYSAAPRLRSARRASLSATTLGLTVVGALLAATLPVAIAPSVAAWTDTEWVNGASIGTELFACGVDTGYLTTASGRFLSATMAGTSLDPIAGVGALHASRSGTSPAQVSPSTAAHPDAGDSDATTDTYTNPLVVNVLQQGVLDLTGLNTGLPIGSAGALNEYVQVTNTGSSAGASGLINNSGGIGFTPETTDAQMPTAANLNLASVLPAGVAGATLSIGAVAASSRLEWCAALEDEIWGSGAVSGVEREYEIASLELVIASRVISELVGEVNAGVTSLHDGSGSLNLFTPSPVANLLSDVLTEPTGTVSINMAAGTVSMNLENLLTGTLGLNGRDANTVLALDQAKVSAAMATATTMLTAWTNSVVSQLELQVPAIIPSTGLIGWLLSDAYLVLNPISRLLTSTLSTLATTLATTVGTLTASLNPVFSALSKVALLTVNVQPDQQNAPTTTLFTAAVPPDSSAEYRVSALHIELLGFATGAQLATVTLATATAGVNARLP